ncbi:MAG: ABC transporter permease [Bacillota bacterium]|nr:ABC transporter permease [Bacillota bacterium]
MEQKFLQDDFAFAEADLDRMSLELVPGNSFLKDVFLRFKKNKGALIAMVLIVIIILLALFGPYINEDRYDTLDMARASMLPKVPLIEKLGIMDGKKELPAGFDANGNKKFRTVDVYEQKKIDRYFLFGTDVMGRDLWTRTWVGTRVSLYMAFLAMLIDIIIGMAYGLISGYFGGKVDLIMQRIVEILNGIPNLVIVTLLVLIMKPGILSITIALVIKGWIGMSQVVRAQVLKLKEQEFILASITLGTSKKNVILKEILPNIFGQVIIMSMFSIPNAIFTESFLAFIGLGLQAPMASLGVLINDGFKSFLVHPYMVTIPTVVLAILMLSFNIMADGLRDAFDPKMKEA